MGYASLTHPTGFSFNITPRRWSYTAKRDPLSDCDGPLSRRIDAGLPSRTYCVLTSRVCPTVVLNCLIVYWPSNTLTVNNMTFERNYLVTAEVERLLTVTQDSRNAARDRCLLLD